MVALKTKLKFLPKTGVKTLEISTINGIIQYLSEIGSGGEGT